MSENLSMTLKVLLLSEISVGDDIAVMFLILKKILMLQQILEPVMLDMMNFIVTIPVIEVKE